MQFHQHEVSWWKCNINVKCCEWVTCLSFGDVFVASNGHYYRCRGRLPWSNIYHQHLANILNSEISALAVNSFSLYLI